MKTRRLTELALLTAIALIIFIIELRLPNLVPIPGVKLGLANIVTVYAVYRCQPREAAMMLVSRIILGALLGGQMMAVVYSLAGGVFCFAGMQGIKRVLPIKFIWMCSVLGAVLHNIGQMAAAVLITQTAGLILYMPVLMLSGCIAGLFTGLCAQFLVLHRNLKDVH